MAAHITDLSGIAPKMDDVAISKTKGCRKPYRCPTYCFAAIGKEASCRCKEELPTVIVFSNIAAAEQNTGVIPRKEPGIVNLISQELFIDLPPRQWVPIEVYYTFVPMCREHRSIEGCVVGDQRAEKAFQFTDRMNIVRNFISFVSRPAPMARAAPKILLISNVL